MSEWYKVGGRFVLRHDGREREYRVRDAAVTFVRHPGGTALALSARTDANESESDTDDPTGASLSIVLNGAEENHTATARWELDRWNDADGLPPPMLYLDDMCPIVRLKLELTEALDKRLVRLEGTAGPFDFRMTACARFAGVTDFDPTLPPGERWWVGHYEKHVAWPNGQPLTAAIWQGTSDFQRLVRACFPLRVAEAVAPVGRIKALARRLGFVSLPPPPPPPPFVPPCSDRQAQFLLAAFIEHFLVHVWRSDTPDEIREIARTIERFADGTPTDADRRAAAPVIGRACFTAQEMFLDDYSPSSARGLLKFAHAESSLPPDSFVHALILEKSRHGCDLLRDVLGDPFQPVRFDSTWLTTTVVSIAHAIYEDRGFDRMPVLADALEEAGCTNESILAHCRGDGPHVRGCWVVDGLLTSVTRD